VRAHLTGLLHGAGTNLPVLLCGDLNDGVDAATTQLLQGPPGSELDTAGVARPDHGDGQHLWNLAARIPLEPWFTRVFRGRRELIDHVFASQVLLGPLPAVATAAAASAALRSVTENPAEADGQFVEAASRIVAAGGFILQVISVVGTIPDNLDVVMKAATSTYGITLAELQHPLCPEIVQPTAFIDGFVRDLERARNQIRLIGSPSVKREATELWGFVFSAVQLKITWAAIASATKDRKDENVNEALNEALSELKEGDLDKTIRGLSDRISRFKAAARSDLGVQETGKWEFEAPRQCLPRALRALDHEAVLTKDGPHPNGQVEPTA